MVKPLGQSVKVPTIGTVKLGDKAAVLDLSKATVLTRAPDKTTYDLNGDGFVDVEVTTRTIGGKAVERVNIDQRDASGHLVARGGFGYNVEDRTITRVSSSDAKGNSVLITDQNHDGKADFEEVNVVTAHGEKLVDRRVGADGKPRITSTMVTTKSSITPGSVTLPKALDVQGFGTVSIGQDPAALDFTKGTLVSQNGQVSVYDRNGDGSQLVTVTNVVDGKDQPVERRVSIQNKDGSTALLFVDAKRNAVSMVNVTNADYTSQSMLQDTNNDGVVDYEGDATFVGNNMRWVSIDSKKGGNTPDQISTSVSTETP